ncbi:MAG: T9SS type A sorting domain-containing protein, partial [Ignavibacteriaceae bacterium]|nr:T9SS type A sorting domain-containing protein [Ignavibacteriaceae bacterium]
VISDASVMKLMVSGELIPAKYSLEQNYPNPFNPSTVIEFSLPEDVSNVKLSIYNALGEKVAELVHTSLVAGRYSYTWNAQNVATGIYIYELRTDNFVSVRKMVLIK